MVASHAPGPPRAALCCLTQIPGTCHTLHSCIPHLLSLWSCIVEFSRDLRKTGKMTATTRNLGAFGRRLRAVPLRAWKVLRVNWHLGDTAFGGPPVHFRIVSASVSAPSVLHRDTDSHARGPSSMKSSSRRRNGSTSRYTRSCSASRSRCPGRPVPRCCTASISSRMASWLPWRAF